MTRCIERHQVFVSEVQGVTFFDWLGARLHDDFGSPFRAWVLLPEGFAPEVAFSLVFC